MAEHKDLLQIDNEKTAKRARKDLVTRRALENWKKHAHDLEEHIKNTRDNTNHEINQMQSRIDELIKAEEELQKNVDRLEELLRDDSKEIHNRNVYIKTMEEILKKKAEECAHLRAATKELAQVI